MSRLLIPVLTICGILAAESVPAAAIRVGYETFHSDLEFQITDYSQAGTPRVSDAVDRHSFAGVVIGTEIMTPVWRGLSAGLEGAVSPGSFDTTVDLSRQEVASTTYGNSLEGDTMAVELRTIPLFFRIGWKEDVARHRFHAAAGLGVVLVAVTTTVHDQYWTNGGQFSSPSPFPPGGVTIPATVSRKTTTDFVPIRTVRFSAGWAWALTETLHVGLEGVITPMPVVIASGTRNAGPYNVASPPGWKFGGTSYGIALRITGGI